MKRRQPWKVGSWPVLVGTALVVFGSASCLTPEQAVAEVDAEAYEIVAAKQIAVVGSPSEFTISPPEGRLAALFIDEETGLVRSGEPVALRLADILELAAQNSREFQDAKEALYRSALGLMRERESFRNSPFGLFDASFTRGAGGVETVRAAGQFGTTNLIERGGSYLLSVGLDFLRVVSSPTAENLQSFLSLSISLPFLRNAELNIPRENLIQADRNALYAIRDFERFKQVLGVNVISSYLDVLSLEQRIKNEAANLASLELTRRRNEALEREGRISIVEVDQARQQELNGQNRVVVARQAFDRSLDTLKILLGIPVDIRVTVLQEDLEGLEALMAEKIGVEEEVLLRLALRSRLDFRNAVDAVTDAARRVELAESQLLPDITLNLSAAPVSQNLKPLKYRFDDGTYVAALDTDFGLDRDIESISLRAAMIDLQRAMRQQEAAAERVKLDVRDALRQLVRARATYDIAIAAVALAQKRVESSQALLAEARVTTRDYLESQDSLIQSQNNLVDAVVDYRIAFLELLRDTGALAVAPGGLDHEASTALLRDA